MALNQRQQLILEIVKGNGPITGEHIANRLNLTRATLRPDLAILTMSGYLDAKPRLGYFYKEENVPQPVYEFLEKWHVKDFMSQPIVISDEVSVYDAICSMFLEDVGTLFVVDNNKNLVGAVSRKDLLRTSIGSNDLHQVPVKMMMTRMPNIVFCGKEDSMVVVAQKIIDKQIDSVPVVQTTDNGLEVIGRITKTNIAKVFIQIATEDMR
ncbi:MAG: transcriptional repressor CcpN [Bacillales bacterium]|jgi:CBS domain-containing protein|nr:transcriptional repressor CcpN [Bacillales bacterium]